jgi:hypothetical protein
MVVHRTVGPQDKKALDEWIRDNAEEGQAQVFKESLAKLGTGEAWFWSVGWLDVFKKVQVRMRETFDSSRTPRPGEKRITPKNLAEVDLEKLKTELADTIEKAKADDPKELKRQIAELKRELAKKPAAQAQTKEIEVPVFPDELRRDLDAIFARLTRHGNQIGEIHATLGETYEQLKFNHEDIRSLIDKYKHLPSSAGTGSRPSNNLPTAVKGTPTPKSQPAINSQRAVSDGDFQLTRAERQILKALFWTKDDKDTNPAKIGFYADYRAGTGSFNNALSSLRSKGLLSGWNITIEGETLASSYAEAKPAGMELREWLRPKLDKCSNEILDVLIDSYPERLAPEQIAERTASSYKAGTGSFNNGLARLRSLEAAEGYGRDGVKASEVFFE